MNIDNMRKLRDYLVNEVDDKHFDIGFWGVHYDQLNTRSLVNAADVLYFMRHYPCRTTACGAGHAVFLASKEGFEGPTGRPSVFDVAQSWLDLTQEEARDLFLEHWYHDDGSEGFAEVSRHEFAAYIDELITRERTLRASNTSRAPEHNDPRPA